MPELPEAETIVRGLRTTVVGKQIVRAEVVRPDILRQPRRRFVTRLKNRRIAGIGRRGKNVVLELDASLFLAVNLGMTGKLLPFPTLPRGHARPSHPAIRFRFTDGGVLVFDDTRRFGTVEALTADEWSERSSRMGPEPLDPGFSADDLFSGLQRSRSPARSWLLDQRRIAGVGNIYASEALHLAGVRPSTPANRITAAQAEKLHRGVQHVLTQAISAGGTTIRDYTNTDGDRGEFSSQLLVYGREGRPCHACGTDVVRTVISNRSAFHCPQCQPAAS